MTMTYQASGAGEVVSITYTVERRYHFECAHFLPYVPEEHRCRRMHGHNYELLVRARHEQGVDARGFVLDFGELDMIVLPLIQQIDHRCLNDIPGLHNPTAELIGMWFLDRLQAEIEPPVHIETVVVYETKDCAAVVSKRPVQNPV